VARVPEAEIGRLKEQVSLVSLAEAAGVTLRRTGADLTGCCPFHEDSTPSLVISPAKNLWHCLGACQAGGSVIDWVMRAEGVSFRHAVELLRDGMPAISAAGRAPGRSTVRKLASPVDRTAADDELLGQVTDYYHRVLKESADAGHGGVGGSRSCGGNPRRGLAPANDLDRRALSRCFPRSGSGRSRSAVPFFGGCVCCRRRRTDAVPRYG
jgi:hypothetical protein